MNSTFINLFMTYLIETYFPKDGSYFRERVYWWETGTNLFVNVSDILKIMSKTDDSTNDESIAMSSVDFISQFDYIVAAIAEQVPEKLKSLQWKCTKIGFQLYNSKQKTGKHRDTGEQMYGAPACMFVLHLEPLTPESIPTYKAKINNKTSEQIDQFKTVGKFTKNAITTNAITNTNANKDCSKCGKSFQPIQAKYHECPSCFVPRTTPMGGAGGAGGSGGAGGAGGAGGPSNTIRTVRGQYTGKK
jgi:hypothetical protein